MDFTNLIVNIVTQLVVLVVGLPQLIFKLIERKMKHQELKMDNTKEKHYKEVVIELIKHDIIKVTPDEAKKLVMELLAGRIDSETAIKQIASIKDKNNAV